MSLQVAIFRGTSARSSSEVKSSFGMTTRSKLICVLTGREGGVDLRYLLPGAPQCDRMPAADLEGYTPYADTDIPTISPFPGLRFASL